ncbi:glycoside hydrolase family 72 protein [Bipolaris victoriae FI3]|uniref:1,3-beta-glucanosyltransferase n=2 Tax=Bipolaris TaxID=33194 RepID=W6Y5Y5_COCC2|nr:glycoside hydrolase family 72 protein [Bipolaris zeicola 26-R-13]XP_014562254.1 glycoside hydrolase family 72 protein [Bipolaris victoriae FI3]EUC33223.1 glycoside hydrolase family 72 protein [Bipolaris zeicola 26-R-13]
MKTYIFAVALAATAAAKPTEQKRASNSKITPVTVKGNAFWAGNERFYIRGVDYQPGGASDAKDPIADEDGCKRDISKFKELGINTVRVYTVDNSANHDTCMGLLADAGIYLALDVNTPKYSINRANPQKSYNKVYLQSLFATVEMFAKYDNTLLFFSGNEVINDDKTTDCAPYVKAVTRDLKSYMNARGLRKVPVGYSAADVESNRYEMADYMNCGDDSVRSDFFGFNDYSWCDPSSYETSGWNIKVQKFSNYSIPIFLSEYGCNTNTRKFEEVKALYDPKMTKSYSGGLVYEYSQEESKYGLVEIDGNNVNELPDFTALKSAFAGTPNPTGDGGYLSNGQASQCPSQSKTWDVTLKSNELPSLPDGAKDFFTKGAGDGPGLKGDGSQDAGSSTPDIGDAGAGAVTSGGKTPTSTGSPTSSAGAAANVRPMSFGLAPIVCGAVVLASSLFGGALVL